jgi:cysteinyl-tRNA synthetase
MDNMKSAYEKLLKTAARIKENANDGEVDNGVFASFKDRFLDALGNDFNTSMALTVLYEALKADTNNATKYAIIKDFDTVLCLNLDKEVEKEGIDSELEAYILKKIEERKEAKKNKDFATADAIRDELAAKGIVLKDTREGTTYTIG